MFPISFVHKRIGSAALGLFSGGPTGAIAGFFGGGGGGASAADPCPGGIPIPGTNRCFETPFVPQIASTINYVHQHGPGGPTHTHHFGDPDDIFTAPGSGGTAVATGGGEAVVGAFGMAALVPRIVGAIEDHHGELRPIRRCPRGSVLGKDDLCYMKIPNSFRKWPKAPRAPVTANDAKCIRKAASATARVERLAKSVGLHTSKSGPRRRSKK